MKKIGFGKLAGLFFVAALALPVVCVAMRADSNAIWDAVLNVSLALLLASFVFFVLWSVGRVKTDVTKWAAERPAKAAAKLEQKKQNAEKAESDRQYRELCKKYEQERKEANRKIVSVVLISTNSKKSSADAAGRAFVGGALLGPVGAIAGAATGTSKATTATFSVKYASGRTAVETVNIGSNRFRELSAFLHK